MSLAVTGPIEDLDLICFCHLRWDFVYQRPQHLMSRFAQHGRVFVIEEPIAGDGEPTLDISAREGNIFVCVPRLAPELMSGSESSTIVAGLVDGLVEEYGIKNYISWFYTPMMLNWSKNLSPRAVIYDCMDELSGFKNAPVELCQRERALFAGADLVFTGGHSLYEAKRSQHDEVYAFPSSIDVEHFGRALRINEDFAEQEHIPHPRVGFVGVIDERMDLGLVDAIANMRPDLNFVMVGPVVKIDENDLPRRENIHYLGGKSYDELPSILAGWDAAMMPFALNESTRYISPTKTPEYLAAGLPVVSTAIADVVRPYGEKGLVQIAGEPEEFVKGLEFAINEDPDIRRRKADDHLKDLSWDKTYEGMKELILDKILKKRPSQMSAEAA